MDRHDAVGHLVSDLHWQIDQMRPRGIKDRAGNPYNPSYYKRGLENAIEQGEDAVVAYVVGYLAKPPSDGYKKLEEADSLDLACEALIADEQKPYAELFTAEQRAQSRARLAPHQKAIDARRREREERVAAIRQEYRRNGRPARPELDAGLRSLRRS